MLNRIGEDDQVLTGVERFAGVEQGVAKGWLKKLPSAADCAVQEQHRVALILRQTTERLVGKPQVQTPAICKNEALCRE